MLCEKKLQSIRIPHVEMMENTDTAVSHAYVLSADIPDELHQLAHRMESTPGSGHEKRL